MPDHPTNDTHKQFRILILLGAQPSTTPTTNLADVFQEAEDHLGFAL